MKGEVTIRKIFRDGSEEVVAKDNNIITAGLGISLVNIFSADSSRKITDYLVGYYQIGNGDHNPEAKLPEDRKYIYNLKSALVEANYGEHTTLQLDNHDQLINTKNFTPELQLFPERNTFVSLSDSDNAKFLQDTVHYRLTVDEESASSISISEFGLFAVNPNEKEKGHESVLIAYKRLDTSAVIEKTAEFSVVIDWELKFVNPQEEETEASISRPNIVFVMVDDLGVDTLGMYDDINPYDISSAGGVSLGTPYSQLDRPLDGCGIYAHTPFLSAMASGGMTFYNARANAMCSPTRARILTGKYAFTSNYFNEGEAIFGHGIGTVSTEDTEELRGGLKGLNSEYQFYNKDGDLTYLHVERPSPTGSPGRIHKQKVIAEYLEGVYHTGIIGKWHLSEWSDNTLYSEYGSEGLVEVMGDGWSHVSSVGKFNDWRMYFHNLNKEPMPDPTPYGMGYVSWILNNNGNTKTIQDTDYVSFNTTKNHSTPYGQGDASSYATHYSIDQASSFCNTATEPFFLYLPLNAPHAPQTYPPSGHVYNDYYNDNHVQRLEHSSHSNMTEELAASAYWINFNAMSENIDNQLSALFYSIPIARRNNTIFIFAGDNGTPVDIMLKIHNFCSSGLAGNRTETLEKNAASGAGTVYNKWMNPDDHLTPRRGGAGNGSGMFKSSVYDRGCLIPMIVSGLGVSGGASSFAFIDAVDILPTILDIGGLLDFNVKTDGYSFYDVLKGSVEAKDHKRQFSFMEVFKAIGNSTGPIVDSGAGNGDGGDPTIPYERRRALVIRCNADELGSTIIPGTNGTQAPVSDASAGVWKLIRSTSGVNWDELYHLRDNDFAPVDQWEMIDYIPQDAKYNINQDTEEPFDHFGFIVENLVLSATLHGSVNDPDDYWWQLARIYQTMFNQMWPWLQYRSVPGMSNLDTLYSQDSAGAAARGVITENTRGNASNI